MFHVMQFASLPSTNDYAKLHGKELDHGAVIVAHHQSAGRGRFQRTWESREDLTFSIVFHRPAFSHAILAPLAVVFALEAEHLKCQIKWPNDVMYQEKKCGGILVERVFDGGTHAFDVVGIGLNLSKSFGPELEEKAIALPIPCAKEKLLHRILFMYQMVLRMDEESLLRQYRLYNMLIGKQITLDGTPALVKDINEQGELIVLQDGTQRSLNSEEITFEMWYGTGGA